MRIAYGSESVANEAVVEIQREAQKPVRAAGWKYPEEPCQGPCRIIETKSPKSTATKNGSTSSDGD